MNIWLIADTHFGHQFLIDNQIRTEGYEKKMWESMYKNIKDDDLLIHLGDLAFKPQTPVGQGIQMVKGHKIFVIGNHDNGFEKYFKMGFDLVCEEFQMRWGGFNFVFTHEPITPIVKGDKINIHGHLHGNNHHLQADLEWYKTYGKLPYYIDMAPEIWGYRVINLTEVIAHINKARLAQQDSEQLSSKEQVEGSIPPASTILT